jgi:putative ABC transport system substrate-binding protein
MRRREFITLLGGAAAWPLAARAQHGERVRRIAVAMSFPEGDAETQTRLVALRSGLRQLGWIEGRNIQIEFRHIESRERLPAEAAAVVSGGPDIILTNGTPVTAAMQAATRTIPIVFTNVADPISNRLVASLARPGENITGFSNYEPAIGGKWMQALKDVVPSLARILVVFSPDNPISAHLLKSVEAGASSFGMATTASPVRNANHLKEAIESFAREPRGGLLTLPDGRMTALRAEIFNLALAHRLPAIYPFRFFAKEGGMMSYGIEASAAYHQAAVYVDRILKGSNPADLPVQNPTKYEFVINLKTAKAIGLSISESLLVRADEVIE